MEYSNLFVTLMGMGTVFFGLVCLIVLTMLMSTLGGGQKESPAPAGHSAAPAPAAVPAPAAGSPPPELIAAVSAALAEDLGTEPAGIRILSMKKV